MNKDVVRKWIKALRSGDYTQARYALRDGNNCFCIIGVLCDLHAKEFKKEYYWKPHDDHYIYNQIAVFPDVVMKWLHTKSYKLSLSHLVHLNDDMGMSFDKLATYIEDEVFGVNDE